MATNRQRFGEDGRLDGRATALTHRPKAPSSPTDQLTGGPGPMGPFNHAPSPADQLDEGLRKLKERLRGLLAALLDRAYGIALDKVEALARTFDEIAARGGYRFGALFGGARAAMTGRSPVWGAIEGAVAALSPGAKAALIAVLVLALLLLPVTVVLVLLFLIVVAIVAVARTRSAH